MINESNYAKYNHQGLWTVRIGSLVAFALLNSWLIPLDGTSHSHWQHDFLIRLFRLYSLMFILPFGILLLQGVRNVSLSRFWMDIDQRQKNAALIPIPMVEKSDTFNRYKPLMIRAKASWSRLFMYYIVSCIIDVIYFSLVIFYFATDYSSAPYTFNDSTIGDIKIMSAIYFFGLFIIFMIIAQTSYLNINANSKGIIVRSHFPFVQSPLAQFLFRNVVPGVIKWREATAYRSFASKEGNLIYYDLHCADRFVRWTKIKKRGLFELGKPSLPQQEYEQQFEQLDAIIQMRTGLTCVEI